MKKISCFLILLFLFLFCGCTDSTINKLDEESSFDYEFSKVYETYDRTDLKYFEAQKTTNSITIITSKSNLRIIESFVTSGNMISSVLSAYPGVAYTFLVEDTSYTLDKIIVSDSSYSLFNYGVTETQKIIQRITTELDYVRNTTMYQALQKQIYENGEFMIFFEDEYVSIERK